MQIKIVPILDIKIKERNRQYNDSKANELAKSIEEIGLLHPVVINSDNTLIAGLHRLKACEMLGWEEIPCSLIDLGNVEELAEIDENLIRAELTELEKADLLCRAKEIHEIRHPESLKANIVKKNLKQFAEKEIISVSEISTQKCFANSIAENIGLSSRSVRQSIQISRIAPEIKEIIKDTPLADSKTELLTLAKLEPDMQKEVVDVISTGGVRKVKEAIYQVRKESLNCSLEKAAQATARDNTDIPNNVEVLSGDIFKLGNNILICGDNTDIEIIEYIGKYHYSLAFADPPYNLGLADYDRAEFTWAQDYLTTISDIVAVTPGINNIKFFLKNTAMLYKWLIICHVKNLHSGCAVGYTHYYSVFLFSNLKSINFGIKDLFDITLPPMPEEDKLIAAQRQKPAGLLTYLIEVFSSQGDFVLDPFGGSGQTLMVCEALNRKCVTIEILPDMVQKIISRYVRIPF